MGRISQEFDFEIIYKPGSSNQVADALSRRPEVAPRVSNIDVEQLDVDVREQLIVGYQEDVVFKDIYISLLQPMITPDPALVSKLKHYQLQDGLLLYQANLLGDECC